jgi:hypothetical protein
LNNSEAVNQYLVTYLRQAGANVLPARDPSLNTSEVVIANTSPAYAETGAWSAASLTGTGYKGSTYRYATTTNSGTATASATWTANIPTSGWYPVYAWYYLGTNRPTDAHYEIDYPLGTHVTIIDQTKHGSTWHYLGTFYFRAGEVARVRLLNTSSVSGKAVIADAVRFGGGTGDYNSGGGVSNKPRWEEASRYWTYFMGAPASVFDSYAGSTTCDYAIPDCAGHGFLCLRQFRFRLHPRCRQHRFTVLRAQSSDQCDSCRVGPIVDGSWQAAGEPG